MLLTKEIASQAHLTFFKAPPWKYTYSYIQQLRMSTYRYWALCWVLGLRNESALDEVGEMTTSHNTWWAYRFFSGGMYRGSRHASRKTIPGTEWGLYICEWQVQKDNCIDSVLNGKGEAIKAACVGFTVEGHLNQVSKDRQENAKCDLKDQAL